MKRPPHHFVVEVRRQRRSTNGSSKSWLEEPRFAAAVASEPAPGPIVFDAKPPPVIPARPQGRILPSLTEAAPIVAIEPAEPLRRGRPRTKIDSELGALPQRRRAAVRADLAAPVEAPVAREEVKIPAAPQEPPRRDAPTVRALAKALAARALSQERPEPRDELPQADQTEARQARHRRILERYVHRAALKPGERWKRRAQKGRD